MKPDNASKLMKPGSGTLGYTATDYERWSTALWRAAAFEDGKTFFLKAGRVLTCRLLHEPPLDD